MSINEKIDFNPTPPSCVEFIKKLRKTRNEIRDLLWRLEDEIKELEVSMNPDPLMEFGKHKGTPISQINKNYVAWLFSSGTLDKYENQDLRDRFRAIINKEGE